MAPTPCCSEMIFLTSLAAFSVTVIGMGRFLSFTRNGWALPLGSPPNSLDGRGLDFVRLLLLLIILDRRLDRILGQNGAVDLHRWEGQFLDDGRVADLHRLADRFALEPFGGQAARRNGAAAAEGLEPGVLDLTGDRVDLDLQPHHVA